MKKIVIILFLIISAFGFFSVPNSAFAYQTVGNDCSWTVTDEFGNSIDNKLQKGSSKLDRTKVNFNIKVPSIDTEHKVEVACTGEPKCGGWVLGYTHYPPSSPTGIIDDSYYFYNTQMDNHIYVNVNDPSYSRQNNPICIFTIEPSDWKEAPTETKSAECALLLDPSININNTTPLTVKGQVKNVKGFDDNSLRMITNDEFGQALQPIIVSKEGVPVTYPLSSVNGLNFWSDIGKKLNGSYTVSANLIISDKNYNSYILDSWTWAKCQLKFDVCDSGCGGPSCSSPYYCEISRDCNNQAPFEAGGCSDNLICCIPSDPSFCTDRDSLCQQPNPCNYDSCQQCSFCFPSISTAPPIPSLAPLCDQLTTEDDFRGKCWDCIDQGKIWTAIGCLPTDFESILKEAVFPIGIGFAGAVAFLYFLYGAFIILTSTGNPERIAQAKEIIISSLSGLLLIIFSVFLLRVIGVDILQIPGFG